MKTALIIPARHASSRFPGKPLVPLLGKPMVLWVAELGAQAVGSDAVYVATEDERIAEVVERAGFSAVMTSDKALTGTDRLAEAATHVDADIYLNVQGDEPLLDPRDILKVLHAKKANPYEVINGYCAIGEQEHAASANIPKVVFCEDKRLVYMSRSLIPGHKDAKNAPREYYKQVCIYAFRREELLRFGNFGRKSVLEQAEDIEILRFLELGMQIRMVETFPGSLAVDTPEDVPPVEMALRRSHQHA